MGSLTEHLTTPDPELHARLPFRADCPMCKAQRLMGPAPPSGLLSDRQRAGLLAGVVAVSAALPATSAIAHGPPPQSPEHGANLPPSGSSVDDEQEGEPPPEAPVAGERPQRPSGPPPTETDAGTRAETRPPLPRVKPRPSREPSPPGEAVSGQDPPEQPEHTASPEPRAPEPAQATPAPEPARPNAPVRPSAPDPPATRPTPTADAPVPTGDRNTQSNRQSPAGQSRQTTPVPKRTSRDTASGALDLSAVQTRQSSGGDSRDIRAGSGREHTRARVAEPGAGNAPSGRSDRTRGGAAADSYVVQHGDSLWAIAKRRLGAGANEAAIAREVNRLWTTNAGRIRSGDPNLIYPGQELRT
jgi:nucleoid-associated protein YgaU